VLLHCNETLKHGRRRQGQRFLLTVAGQNRDLLYGVDVGIIGGCRVSAQERRLSVSPDLTQLLQLEKWLHPP
jgi:hypothetical protein